jgi:hypothetical protein
MSLSRILCAVAFIVFSMSVAFPQATSSSPPQSDEDARRREAERVAAERAREAELKREAEARKEEFNKLRPPTPEERLAQHRRMFPDFLKNVRKLGMTGREIADASSQALTPSNEKTIRKKAKALEASTDTILDYITFDSRVPEAPKVAFNAAFAERLRLAGTMSESIMLRLNEWMKAQTQQVIDLHSTTALITELQTFKLLVRSIR